VLEESDGATPGPDLILEALRGRTRRRGCKQCARAGRGQRRTTILSPLRRRRIGFTAPRLHALAAGAAQEPASWARACWPAIAGGAPGGVCKLLGPDDDSYPDAWRDPATGELPTMAQLAALDAVSLPTLRKRRDAAIARLQAATIERETMNERQAISSASCASGLLLAPPRRRRPPDAGRRRTLLAALDGSRALTAGERAALQASPLTARRLRTLAWTRRAAAGGRRLAAAAAACCARPTAARRSPWPPTTASGPAFCRQRRRLARDPAADAGGAVRGAPAARAALLRVLDGAGATCWRAARCRRRVRSAWPFADARRRTSSGMAPPSASAPGHEEMMLGPVQARRARRLRRLPGWA
jgi:hypothetical protein